VVIVDTAGRLHVDEEMMREVEAVKEAVQPRETLFVVDAMTGQDAVNTARAFHERIDFDGAVLTKMDGDARGGAALSIQAVIQKPVKLLGVGEKLDALEVFHPDRMASRILGMGDVLSFIEKAEEAIDEEAAIELEEKLRKNAFTLEDFRDQLKMIRKLGSLEDLLKMIPGLGKMRGLQPDEGELTRVVAIIDSMTPTERRKPEILNASRRRRIAGGSGTRVEDVNRLMKKYQEARKLIQKMNKAGLKRGGKLRQMGKMFAGGPGGIPFGP